MKRGILFVFALIMLPNMCQKTFCMEQMDHNPFKKQIIQIITEAFIQKLKTNSASTILAQASLDLFSPKMIDRINAAIESSPELDKQTKRLWNGETSIISCRNYYNPIYMSIHPEKAMLATASADGMTTLWDTNTGAQLWQQHLAPETFGVLFNHLGNFLAVISRYKISMVDEDGQDKIIFTGFGQPRVPLYAFSPDDKLFVLGCTKNDVNIWDMITKKYLTSLDTTTSLKTLGFEYRGVNLIALTEGFKLLFWIINRDEPGKTKLIKKIQIPCEILKPLVTPIAKLALACCSNTSQESVINILMLTTGNCVNKITLPTNNVTLIKVSPKNRFVFLVINTIACIYDRKNDNFCAVLKEHDQSNIINAEFSLDGNNLATADTSGFIKLWPLQNM